MRDLRHVATVYNPPRMSTIDSEKYTWRIRLWIVEMLKGRHVYYFSSVRLDHA